MNPIRTYFSKVTELLQEIDEQAVAEMVDLFWDCYQSGRRLVVCGNGGSASTAGHFVTDLQKNLYLGSHGTQPWEVLSLAESIPMITAWSNDTEYANVFAGQARCWLRPGDLLLAISGSGNSPNVLAAVDAARAVGAVAVGWSGYGGGKLADKVDYRIALSSHDMQHVEDAHMILAHVVFVCLRERQAEQQAAKLAALTQGIGSEQEAVTV